MLACVGRSQGKTFIVANVIQEANLPTLVLAPNKVSPSHGLMLLADHRCLVKFVYCVAS